MYFTLSLLTSWRCCKFPVPGLYPPRHGRGSVPWYRSILTGTLPELNHLLQVLLRYLTSTVILAHSILTGTFVELTPFSWKIYAYCTSILLAPHMYCTSISLNSHRYSKDTLTWAHPLLEGTVCTLYTGPLKLKVATRNPRMGDYI